MMLQANNGFKHLNFVLQNSLVLHVHCTTIIYMHLYIDAKVFKLMVIRVSFQRK